jgi:hypothetical protein
MIRRREDGQEMAVLEAIAAVTQVVDDIMPNPSNYYMQQNSKYQ